MLKYFGSLMLLGGLCVSGGCFQIGPKLDWNGIVLCLARVVDEHVAKSGFVNLVTFQDAPISNVTEGIQTKHVNVLNGHVNCRDVYDDPFSSSKPWKRFIFGCLFSVTGFGGVIFFGRKFVNNHMRWWDWIINFFCFAVFCIGLTLILFGHAWPPKQECSDYNFVKRHSTIRCTPAMAAGVANTFWSVGDLVEAAA